MRSSPLLDLARELHAVQSLPDAMKSVREAIARNTRYDRVYTTILSEDRRSYQVVGYVLPDSDFVEQQVASVELDKDLFLQRVFASEVPLVFEDMRLVEEADQAQVAAFGLRTAIGVPMMNGNMRLGPLQISTFADQGVMAPTEDEMDFFVQAASLMAVVVARIRSEERRAQLERQVLASQRLESLGRLAGEVAHDFNNLFMAILANADLALDELEQHPAEQSVSEIREATLRAARLGRQLLAFSKGQVLEQRALDLVQLVSSTIQVARPLFPDEIELRLLAAKEPCHVQGDQGQLERVIMNLLINARDSIDGRGQVSLEVHGVQIDQSFIATASDLRSGRYVQVSVSDDGRGISAEDQERIFEPFFTTKPSDRGTGLGLAVVQGVIAQHGGQIVLYSEPGIGTTFKIYLPCTEAVPVPTQAKVSEPSRSGGDESVLVVDDVEEVREAIARVLRRAGYQVQVAEDVEQALELVRRGKPDLVLTDMVMTGGGGMQLADQLKRETPGLPVLLMTGYAPSQISSTDLPRISKPFPAAELLVRVRQLLDRDRSHRPPV